MEDKLQDKIKKLKSGIADVHLTLDDILTQVERQGNELTAAQERLQEESGRLAEIFDDSQQVSLNVGGSIFTTTTTTLRNAPSPSLFAAMFSGRHKLTKDSQGCYFLDRDGRHFHDILNFLRDGKLNYPSDGQDYKYLLELRSEAEFYGLTGLVAQIDRYPYGIITVKRVSLLNLDETWVYDDGTDEVVFTVDKRCQLSGVGLCGTLGGFTTQLQLLEVRIVEEESGPVYHPTAHLQEAAQSYTKVDGEIVKLHFSAPVLLVPGKLYMLRAHIQGTESYLCEECLEVVIAGGVRFEFQHWESPNGTTSERGQFPELYIRVI